MRLLAILFLCFIAVPLVLFKVVLILLGYPIVALGLLFTKVEETKYFPERVVDDPWKMVIMPKWIDFLYGSEKYGAQGNWFWNDEQDTTTWLARFMWLAVRNPVSNLYNVFPIYRLTNVDNNNIGYIGTDAVYDFKGGEGLQLSWYYKGGIKFGAGLHYVHKWKNRDNVLRFRLGYKFQPNEKNKISNPNLSINFAANTKI